VRNPIRIQFIRDVVLTTGVRVFQALGAMAAGIIVARVLGPTANGTLSVLVALGGMALLLGSLGLHFSAVYFIGRHKTRRDEIISNTLFVGVVGGLVSAAGLAVAVLAFRRQLLGAVPLEYFFVYLAVVPCAYFNVMARTAILGSGQVGTYNLPDLFEGVGLFLGTGILLGLVRHLGLLVGLRVLIEVTITVFLVLHIRSRLRFRLGPSLRLLREQAQYGLRNYSSSLLWVFLLQSDLVLCNYFLGKGPTGVYSVAVSLGLPVTLLSSVVGLLTFQRVSLDEDRSARIANTNRTLRVLVPLVAGLALLAGILAPFFVPIIYGDRFNGAVGALTILLPGLFLLSLETVLMNFLSGEGSPPIVYFAPAAGLTANFVANLFVIPRYGINGAAATSSVCYGLVYLLVLAYYLRWTESRLRNVLLLRKQDIRALWTATGLAAPAGTFGG
jgi:O-antigen/teichoic acid export membrane protein